MKQIIIGGGPAGMMCACIASQNPNNQVFLIDSNQKLGKKLFITGKGRCNLTNNCLPDEFLENVCANKKFLMSAIHTFAPSDCINFFESHGLKLVTERGRRVFPQSNKASDVTKTLSKILQKNGVQTLFDCKVDHISKEGETFVVCTSKGKFECDALVVATGGKSYASTGATGDGYAFAKSFGHTIVEPKPSLVPILIKNHNPNLAGLTLKNVCASINVDGKTHSQFGEVLFTHQGVSGPAILTLSAILSRADLANKMLCIDLKPAISVEQLENRLGRDETEFGAKNVANYLKTLMPQSLIQSFLNACNLSGQIKLHSTTKAQKQAICHTLKNFCLTILDRADFDCAVVTSGGVCTKQIDPKTMQSKLVSNLFFVGEVLDVDALTGGFNIQIALSTGFVCGKYLCQL